MSKVRASQEVWSVNIEKSTLSNNYYRKVVYTDKNLQVVYMSLNMGESIPMETHPKTSQFVRIESGRGILKVRKKRIRLHDGKAFVIPPGILHLIYNTGNVPLKLYTIYTPPEHSSNVLQKRMP